MDDRLSLQGESRSSGLGALSRREFLRLTGVSTAGLLIGGNLLAACGGEDGAAGGVATVRTQLNWLMNAEFAGHWIADDQGFYAQEDIKPVWITGGPEAPRPEGVVVAGRADIGQSTFMETTIRAIIEGADIKIFAAVFQHSPLALMSHPDRPILSAADMVGKRIGGPPQIQANIQALFKVNDLPEDYTFVPLGGTDPQPLIGGDVDAMYVFLTNQPLIFEEEAGVEPTLLPDSQNNFDAYSTLIFARSEYLREEADTAARWLRATIKGWEKNLEDPELGARLAVEKYGVDLGLDLEQQIGENEAQNGIVVSDVTEEKGLLWISQDFIENSVYPGLRAAGLTDLPEVDEIADFSILEEAYQGKTQLLES